MAAASVDGTEDCGDASGRAVRTRLLLLRQVQGHQIPPGLQRDLGGRFHSHDLHLGWLYFWIWRHARAHKRILRKLTVSSVGSPSVSSLSSTVSSFNSGSVGNSPSGATGNSSSVKTRKSSATNGHSQKKSVSQSDSLPSTNECTTGSDDITFVTLSVSESPVTNGNAKQPRSVSLSADVECSLENGANGTNEGYFSNGYCPKKNATSRSKSLSSSTEVPRIDGNDTPRSFRKGRNQHKYLHRVRSGSVSSTVSSVTASDIDSQGGQSPASVRKGRRRRSTTRSVDKTTIVAFSVTLVFVISFLPYLALMFVRAVIKDFDYTLHTPAQLNFYNIFIRFYLLNSAANPVIYGVLNEKFRKECWALCNRICCCLPKRLRNRR
ncbi:hypothetical protein BaRGS_00029686 [Batillaria attramentaria]|uniref:G-protein coupled receptors family 1 profile domain-containing protein n=1 Tax=Batillaria attramentaria TaxID=370345 RepID=A0ABD0JWH9_9CAEN